VYSGQFFPLNWTHFNIDMNQTACLLTCRQQFPQKRPNRSLPFGVTITKTLSLQQLTLWQPEKVHVYKTDIQPPKEHVTSQTRCDAINHNVTSQNCQLIEQIWSAWIGFVYERT
jgi:hypothetical protein